MTAFVEAMNDWSASWAALVWAVVWQSTLLAAGVALIAYLLRQSSPAVRYWLWQIVMIKLLLMPFWTLAVPLPVLVKASEPAGPSQPVFMPPPSPSEDRQPAAIENSPPKPATQPIPSGDTSRWAVLRDLTWRSWLLLGWSAIIAAQVVRIFRQRVRLARLLRTTKPAGGELVEQARQAANDLGLKRAPAVVLTNLDCSPFVCRALRPVLVLPHSLTATLNATALRHVLLHELAHVKRRDLIWGWIAEIARIVYFFHPAAHWAAFQIRLERELACDQLVMAVTSCPAADYADTLIQVVAHASEPSALKAAVSTLGLNGYDDSCQQANSRQEHQS
jgi:beta-lactamase regulating signal transducer with metallopeptidase domain